MTDQIAEGKPSAHEFPYGIADVVAREMLAAKDAEIATLTANQCSCRKAIFKDNK